jgi:aminoglycoside phosphotransferase (APT) family kinase protein
VTALEIEHADGTAQKVVVREYGAADLASDPQIAEHEFRLLQHLHTAGLPVPQAYAVDQSGALLPTPCIVVEFVDGHTEFAPADLDVSLLQLVRQLARIHQVSGNTLDFLPNQTEKMAEKLRQRPAQLDASINEGRIRAALENCFPLQHNPTCLLHGDYWLGNILWRDGQIAAIIDWEDAAIGDPLADLANARLELVFAFGIEAMQAFTRHYQAQTLLDYANLPYWDLCAALKPAHKISEWAGDTEHRWRAGHAVFVAQAFERLA